MDEFIQVNQIILKEFGLRHGINSIYYLKFGIFTIECYLIIDNYVHCKEYLTISSNLIEKCNNIV